MKLSARPVVASEDSIRVRHLLPRSHMWLLADLSPQHVIQLRENKKGPPKRKPQAFHNLGSDVIPHHFCHILFIRCVSVNPVYTQGERITQSDEQQEVRLLRPILEATYHIHPNIMHLILVSGEKHWTTDEKGNYKDIYLIT